MARSVGVDRAMTFTARTNAFGDPLPAAQRSAFGSECQLFWKPGGCGGTDAGRCGVTENGELYAWYLDAAAWCEDSNPLCQFAMGAPVRTGCSRAERAGYFVECCVHAEGMDGAVDCVDTIDWNVDATGHCPESSHPHACQAMRRSGWPEGAEICGDTGDTCEVYEHTGGRTCSEVCGAAGLQCLDGWDDDPNTISNCDHHLIAGVQSNAQMDQTDTSFESGQLDAAGSHQYGVGGCENPYGTQICKCASSTTCHVQTDYPFSWVDITTSGTQITEWEQNADDGWYHIELPFAFNWFGSIERTVTVGTNGVLTFGSAHMPNGASEPVPCAWEDTSGDGAGCVGNNYGSQAGSIAAGSITPPDGVIAVFWADLTAAEQPTGQEGVFYQVVPTTNAAMIAWNKLVVEYQVPIWTGARRDGRTDAQVVHFEVILFGDGTVLMQYLDMPATAGGSWSQESIGFEDQTGNLGVQISYGQMPAPQSAYHIPASCHVPSSTSVLSCGAMCGQQFGPGTSESIVQV